MEENACGLRGEDDGKVQKADGLRNDVRIQKKDRINYLSECRLFKV
jgi:hypothetical protein